MRRMLRWPSAPVCSAMLVALVALAISDVAVGTGTGEQLESEQAAVSLAGTDAAAVGADAASQADEIKLLASGEAFTSRGTDVDSEIPRDPRSPLSHRDVSRKISS